MSELREFLAGRPGMPMGTSTIGFVELVSYDRRMLDVAHSMGLPTAAPGLADAT
ncbi:hypothetical protein [Phytohabitans rumicis]|uniref:Uncharacterized protein n=1 Tax=Phytohabitans rumicis TaxID=1076125 RepID=A0A6V8LJC5_9ACTN|nr:hypothetical protein [Phytohabitans rumicis]GFJ94729.1 hypothetical protein Prum_083710 [Phytohabitans rumicis]